MASNTYPLKFWHCRATSIKASRTSTQPWDIVVNDYTFEQLQREIIAGWKQGIHLFLKGKRIDPNVANIQIVYTPQSMNNYTLKAALLVTAAVVVIEDLAPGKTSDKKIPWEQDTVKHIPFDAPDAIDYTNELLLKPGNHTLPTALSLPSSSAEMRKSLENTFKHSSDLNAFCMDYFPNVYKKFSQGMNTTDKLNLLLLEDLNDIQKALDLNAGCY